MKKSLFLIAFLIGIIQAGDKVVIGGYENYPTASGCASKAENNNDKNNCVLLANGTLGEVVEWDKKYTKEGKSIYAQMDMFTQNKVMIISGPAKGKILYVDHLYLTLKY